jgi:hypothetical protein
MNIIVVNIIVVVIATTSCSLRSRSQFLSNSFLVSYVSLLTFQSFSSNLFLDSYNCRILSSLFITFLQSFNDKTFKRLTSFEKFFQFWQIQCVEKIEKRFSNQFFMIKSKYFLNSIKQ